MNTLHAAGTTAPHGQLAAAPRPTPPAKRPADESEGVALTVIPAVVGALVGLGILVAVGLTLAGQAGGLAALGTALLGAQSAWYLSRASAFADSMTVVAAVTPAPFRNPRRENLVLGPSVMGAAFRMFD